MHYPRFPFAARSSRLVLGRALIVLFSLAILAMAAHHARAQTPDYNFGSGTAADIVIRTDKAVYEAGEPVQFCFFMFQRPGEKTTILTLVRPAARQYNIYSFITANFENCSTC